MSCKDCSPIEPIEDEGEINLRPAYPLLVSVCEGAGYALTVNDNRIKIAYSNRDELLRLVKLAESLEKELASEVYLYITGNNGNRFMERWVTLPQLSLQLSNRNLIDIIMNAEFTSHMQPIVDASESIVGFEFLLRPKPMGSYFQPFELFEIARQTGFHSFLDRAARISAIESSARFLPKGIKRFINFLPSSIYNPQYCLTHTFAAIHKLAQDPADFVFEVVETENISNIAHLESIFAEYRNHGISVALDDVGSGYSTLEVMSRLKPDYVKIDRSLISYCDEDVLKQGKIGEIMQRAGQFGGKVLAEGIERREEFVFCREIGIDLGQGYLFGKPADKPPANFGNSA
ncbi:EAL domain-containing protein [Paenibacillus sp. sgz500958]|uniref:EAL domain-containing protein n=1 Tax=Paenibacillus sp. sgz500958 TaxID=3242475 RepID=UPI0036D3ED8C